MIDLRPDDDLPDPDHLAAVHAAVAPFYGVDDVPEAFSPAFLELVPGSYSWLCALVRAAQAWWAEGQGLGAPSPRAMSALSGDVSAAADWTRWASEPSHAELVERRRWAA